MYSDHASLVELKTSEDGPIQVEVLDSPSVTCLLHPPNATVQNGTKNDSQAHNVLKCWILFVLIHGDLIINKYMFSTEQLKILTVK